MKKLPIILSVTLLFGSVVAAMIWHLSQLQSEMIESTALRTSELYSIALTQFRTLYTSEVVEKARKHGLEITHEYESRDDAIPLPATLSMMLGEEIGKQASGATSYLYSPYPFRIRENTFLLDEFNTEAWEFLTANPQKPYYRFEQQKNSSVLRYATADVMRPQCVACHNSHPESPKTDWKAGDVRGVLVVNLPLNTISAHTRDDLRETSISYAAVGIGIAAFLGMVMIRLRRQSDELAHRVKERTADLESEILRRQKTEERFRQAIEAAPAAMIMVDQEGVIAHANHEAARLFDYTVGTLVGQSIEALIPSDKRAHHPLHRKNYIGSPVSRRMGGLDLLAQKKQGEKFPVEIRLNPMNTPDGIVILCSIVDLTERKKSVNTILEQAKELEAANDLLEEQATTDSLTEIANRRSWNHQVETILKLSGRYDHPVSVLLADVDHFKKYNDDLGHPAGDRALTTIARALLETSRSTDFVARYGGEEFAVLLPETDQDGALAAAEKLRSAVKHISSLDRKITMSIGAATLRTKMKKTSDLQMLEEQLIEQADKALYRSKESGRNRITHFNDMGEI
ncbi:MAG: diguanylate cyclase [Gammaproteobacteria bacterium]|nr:diguanylate cyclase [Gammaproteobacteria bacterium]